jgi:hypothetical protein
LRDRCGIANSDFLHTGEVPRYENKLEQIVAELNRAVSPTANQPTANLGSRDSRQDSAGNPASLDALLAHAGRLGASDLLLIADVPVTLRVGGFFRTRQAHRSPRRVREIFCCPF